ncbi:hypothetical protein TNCV_930951 [Trichonephila clavipes]|uniref:Uncharacterized protein n=1 Tax=Trichonephila clavipes TaxID=2585209 RepID=A0A8X6W2U5_TRICX|nr:hypothetical protein TNCV_930951 [Trichonephila clavipes]
MKQKKNCIGRLHYKKCLKVSRLPDSGPAWNVLEYHSRQSCTRGRSMEGFGTTNPSRSRHLRSVSRGSRRNLHSNAKLFDVLIVYGAVDHNEPTARHLYICTRDIIGAGVFHISRTLQVRTATAGSDVVQSERPIFDDFFQHLWPYIGNNTANVVFQIVKRLWLIRIDQ